MTIQFPRMEGNIVKASVCSTGPVILKNVQIMVVSLFPVQFVFHGKGNVIRG